jgi:hypothetical protein
MIDPYSGDWCIYLEAWVCTTHAPLLYLWIWQYSEYYYNGSIRPSRQYSVITKSLGCTASDNLDNKQRSRYTELTLMVFKNAAR